MYCLEITEKVPVSFSTNPCKMTLIALFKNTRTFLSRRGSAIFIICFSNIFFICKIAKKHEKNMRKMPSNRPLLKTDSFLRISSLQISWFLEMFKVNNRNTWTRCEICSKLTIKTPGRRQLWAGNYQLGPHICFYWVLILFLLLIHNLIIYICFYHNGLVHF